MSVNTSNDDKMRFVSGSDYNQNLEQNFEGDLASTRAKTPAALNVQSKNQTTINLGQSSSSYKQDLVSTLDEPVSVTINRDLKAIAYKLGHVFFPKKSNLLLRDWDLWGLLI